MLDQQDTFSALEAEFDTAAMLGLQENMGASSLPQSWPISDTNIAGQAVDSVMATTEEAQSDNQGLNNIQVCSISTWTWDILILNNNML